MARLLQAQRRLITAARPIRGPLGALKIDRTRMPRGLQFFFYNQNDPMQEIVQNRTVISYNARALMNVTSAGPGFGASLNASSTYVSLGSLVPAQCSVEAFLVLHSLPAANVGINRISDIDPDNGTFDRCLFVDATANLEFYIYDGNTEYTASTATAVVGVPIHLVGTSSGSLISIYVNGQLSGAPKATGNGGYNGYAAPVFSQGQGRAPGGIINPTYTILHSGFANVAWTADEVMRRYLDMYGFLIPDEGEMPALRGPAAPPTVFELINMG